MLCVSLYQADVTYTSIRYAKKISVLISPCRRSYRDSSIDAITPLIPFFSRIDKSPPEMLIYWVSDSWDLCGSPYARGQQIYVTRTRARQTHEQGCVALKERKLHFSNHVKPRNFGIRVSLDQMALKFTGAFSAGLSISLSWGFGTLGNQAFSL